MTDRRERRIQVTVNGIHHDCVVSNRTLLSDFIRQQLGLTGTHVGCEHGVCGACTVLLNGSTIRSCLMLAVQADGCEIVTVEGLAIESQLNDLQESFWSHHALQCGFCTPGFLLTGMEILQVRPAADEEALRELLSGNLCRCTGYQPIVDAIAEVLRRRQSQE